MVEIDEDMAAVWQSVVDGHAGWLAKRILDFDLTKETVIQEISKTDVSIKEKALTGLGDSVSHSFGNSDSCLGAFISEWFFNYFIIWWCFELLIELILKQLNKIVYISWRRSRDRYKGGLKLSKNFISFC
ncbi:MAG: hypothetical protein MAG551_00331 [Candidatus Scalindua arabica]|uniref:Uncharacterized protein n=1 Tax=Candidatus Scalindua arabica TaxID=1127984 RepID=A0A941W0H3_9BACT|nr:hypothetical protein [Candidatus Scalindua arabica]